MKSMINLKNAIAVALILFGVVLAIQTSPKPVIDDEEIAILDIKEPSKEIVELVKPISDLIKDPTDRAKLAIFNQEFANRIKNYGADNQQTNDVYVLAASYFFKDSLNDKYEDLDTKIVDLLKSSIGEDNHILTQEEKTDIANKFLGLAWSLIQK
jgi:hypothetical protein